MKLLNKFNKLKIFLISLFHIKKVKLLNDKQTLKKIKVGYSISRFGDGELIYMFDFKHSWQSQNKDLRNNLKNIFKNKPNNLIIGIPDFLLIPSLKRKYLNMKGWQLPSYCLKIILNNKYEYGSAFLFRPLNFIDRIDKSLLNDILFFFNSKKIIYAGTDKEYEKFINPYKVINNISDLNSYEKYYEFLLDEILIYKKENNILILITCGVMGSLLASDLCKNGLQALDIGSFFKHLRLINENKPLK